MSETLARVVRVEGESAWVEVEAPSSCGACGGRGCGSSSVFGQLFRARPASYPVHNAIAAEVGDSVIVAVADGELLRAALRGYGVPLSLLLAGAVIGLALAGEIGSIVGAVSGLLLGAVSMRRIAAGRPSIVRHGGAEDFSCSTHR
ncbi:MAG: SoxR reducing system RseC family protein [Betaproteobacteria bacterium]|nr:SoxR reducing system RseC family protein [Betaproteobacteria bacterium]